MSKKYYILPLIGLAIFCIVLGIIDTPLFFVYAALWFLLAWVEWNYDE